jgi:dihydroorotase
VHHVIRNFLTLEHLLEFTIFNLAKFYDLPTPKIFVKLEKNASLRIHYRILSLR